MQTFFTAFISPQKCIPNSTWLHCLSRLLKVYWVIDTGQRMVSFFTNGNDACLHKWCSDFCHKSQKVWCDFAGESPNICVSWLDPQFSVSLSLPTKHTDSHTENYTHIKLHVRLLLSFKSVVVNVSEYSWGVVAFYCLLILFIIHICQFHISLKWWLNYWMYFFHSFLFALASFKFYNILENAQIQ